VRVVGTLAVTRTQRLDIEVSVTDILALVRQKFAIPVGAQTRVYVDVPGGGDWSNEELDCLHPVQVRIEWSEEEESPLTPPEPSTPSGRRA
jgi:hypothetical protein